MSDLITSNPNLPAFLQGEHDLGTQDLGQFIVPPRIKIIQPISRGEYKELFNPGDAVLIPQKLKITGLQVDEKSKRPLNRSDDIIFTPLFFFPEYCIWNPQELKGQPMIRERSFDSKSRIAAMARDRDQRMFPCPEMPDKKCRAVEHLNFVILLHLEGFSLMPSVLSFARAEHRAGSNFAALIKMRMAPMYACKFVFHTAYRENEQGQWYGIDVENPPEAVGAFLDEASFIKTKQMYTDLKTAHDERRIVVDHQDEDTLEGQVVNSEL